MAKKRRTLTEQEPAEVSGDRRNKRRYPIELPVKYKIMKNYLVMGTGSGCSLDISSGGIAFTSSTPLKVGSFLELSISWPVLLNESCALKLVPSRPLVRSGPGTPIRLNRYEFRTTGAKQYQMEAAAKAIALAFR